MLWQDKPGIDNVINLFMVLQWNVFVVASRAEFVLSLFQFAFESQIIAKQRTEYVNNNNYKLLMYKGW